MDYLQLYIGKDETTPVDPKMNTSRPFGPDDTTYDDYADTSSAEVVSDSFHLRPRHCVNCIVAARDRNRH